MTVPSNLKRLTRLPRVLWHERRTIVQVDINLVNRHNLRRAWMMTDPVEFNRRIESLLARSLDRDGFGCACEPSDARWEYHDRTDPEGVYRCSVCERIASTTNEVGT